MTQPNDLKMQLICHLRAKDVELSEDLYRRMGPCNTVTELNNFFHGTLAQYTGNTMDLRSSLLTTDEFSSWLSQFMAKIFPYISKKRLPPVTNTQLDAQYTSQSKSL